MWDARSAGWFTGDNFGMALPEFHAADRVFIFPTTTPVQFDPDAMRASIDRMLATAPRQMFLTHYGSIGHVADCGARLKTSIDDTVRVALAHRDPTDPTARLAALTAALVDLYVHDARALGVTRAPADIAALLHEDAALNAAGLVVWLDRRPHAR